MLIVEGADGVGKTNAAKRLVEMAKTYQLNDSGFPVYYSHATRFNDFFDYHSHYLDMVSQYAVQDRFHLSSLVYHDEVMEEDKLRVIEGWLLSVGSLICVIATDDETWYETHLKASTRKEMFSTEQIIESNRKYLNMVGIGRGNVVPEAQPHIDKSYIVNGQNGFVPDKVLEEWLRQWYRRLCYVAPNC